MERCGLELEEILIFIQKYGGKLPATVIGIIEKQLKVGADLFLKYCGLMRAGTLSVATELLFSGQFSPSLRKRHSTSCASLVGSSVDVYVPCFLSNFVLKIIKKEMGSVATYVF